MRLNTIFKDLGMANECSLTRTWYIFSNHAVSLSHSLTLTHTRARAHARTYTLAYQQRKTFRTKFVATNEVQSVQIVSEAVTIQYTSSSQVALTCAYPTRQFVINGMLCQPCSIRGEQKINTQIQVLRAYKLHNAVMPTGPQVSSQKRR